ncbi:glycosyltransferase [Microbacterium terricola]|uniref:Glycosyl transferase family 1 domain-containing protein n=1 Tax=Microbacterium terricola TaxID=344163 RepID=A0ABM8DV72_9MICO|nr:glycosyltransferase [Microbacterium terricola]UYK39738.1 glycosyltransferase [Microbacterium terricola]BDV29512.1 hypothetical protein Microterr_01720 [Microbacterium terricola]
MDRPDLPAPRSRRRVLISAYACGPVSEPEASAGWQIAVAAAETSDVWVITRPRFRSAIDAALAEQPALREHLHPHYLDLAPRLVARKRRGWDLYWYYALWQRALGRRARELHRLHGFDVAHHATFANDWMPCGLTALDDVPLVWGPVGGSSRVPVGRLRRWLGTRGTVTELVRGPLTGLARRLWGRPAARRAALIVAQNPDVAAAFARDAAAVVVEPNACIDDLPQRDASAVRAQHAVFAGRLVAWKGAAVAIDAIATPAAAGWTLTIYGDGYERARLERQAHRLGLGERVEFAGHRPRDEVLEGISRAAVFLFPSMHDQAGWVVAEASTMGCPVVCLPLGGPPVLAEPNGFVPALGPDLPARLARELSTAAAAGATPTARWSAARLPGLVDDWYRRAGASAAPTRRVRVLESFGTPKPTTNPYITQLHRSLVDAPDVEVQTFTYRGALTGRYDVVHTHWPELMGGGHRGVGRAARRTLALLTIARWRLLATPVVRTRHNLERPSDLSRTDRRILDGVDAATTLDIALNDHTPPRDGIGQVVIPHGHYREWFAPLPARAPVPGRVAYVGLIRRYKGVEDLIGAFAGWERPGISLHVAGKPSTPELIEQLRADARGDDRVTFDPRFLEEPDFVAAITSAELIVLPYRHMHNSGTALAALSLDRPVLVPDNDVNRALAAECGPGWVHLFSGALSAGDLERAWVAARDRDERPDLSHREWGDAGALHAAAFRAAPRRRKRDAHS